MTAHDWFIEHRTEYAAGVLSAEEMAAFAAHLEGCEACRAAVQRAEDELRWLPMAAAPVTPRPGFERQIIEHALGRTTRGAVRRWSLPIGIAAALICGVVGWQLGQRQLAVQGTVAVAPTRDPAAVDSAEMRLLALRDTLSIMKQAARVLQARIMMHGKEGGMVIFADAQTHRWNVVVHGLPAAPVDGRYQFWFICADGMVRGAEVTVDPAKPMIFTTGMPVPSAGEVLGAALTIEPMTAVSGPPRGKTLAHIML